MLIDYESCCFTGHRDLPNVDEDKLYSFIEELIRRGIKTFYCGMAVGFDMICGETVVKLKLVYPHIKLIACIPCACQEKYFSEKDKRRYYNLLKDCDEAHIPDVGYSRGAMLARDRKMVDCSDLVVCYLFKDTGGTKYTVDYAQKKMREVINLYGKI